MVWFRFVYVYFVLACGWLSLGAMPVEKTIRVQTYTLPLEKPKEGEEPRLLGPTLTKVEYDRLAIAALNGSEESAAALFHHDSFWGFSKEAIYWGMVSVENGGEPTTRYNLAFELTHSTDPLLQRRGRFWLGRVTSANSDIFKLARNLLKELDQKKLGQAPMQKRHPTSAGSWPSTAKEVAQLRNDAIDGSVEAALTLVKQSNSRKSESDAVFWGMVAVENNLERCQEACLSLARTLANSSNARDQLRSRFWLKRLIAEHGQYSNEANNILKKLNMKGTANHI